MIKRAANFLALCLLVLVVGLFSIQSAFAQTVTRMPYWYNSVSTQGTVKKASAESFCQFAAPFYGPASNDRYVYSHLTWGAAGPGISSASCYGIRPLGNGTPVSYISALYTVCPIATPVFDGSNCVAGTAPDPCSDKNPFIRRFDYSGIGPFPAPANYGECVVEGIEMLVCRKDITTGKNYCMWMVKRTGAKFDGTELPETGGVDTPEKATEPTVVSPGIKGPAQGKCPAGTVQGGVSGDGMLTCFGTGTKPKSTPPPPPKSEITKTEATPDGGTKTTTTITTTNSDGSKTITTNVTTTAPDGSKATTTDKSTTVNSAGKEGTDESNKEDEKYDMCKQNPMLTICRSSSVSGTCGQISCEGDAIQCATLRAAASMECKVRDDEAALKAHPLTAKGQAAIDGTDLSGLPSPKNGTSVNIPTLSAGSQGWLGNGSAFDDVSITVQGHQIVLPLSKWSAYLISLRYVMMIIASLISFRILGSAILKE